MRVPLKTTLVSWAPSIDIINENAIGEKNDECSAAELDPELTIS